MAAPPSVLKLSYQYPNFKAPPAPGLPRARLELADGALAATMPSMRQALKLHPDSLCCAATHIDVDVWRPHAGSLVMRYFVTGKISDLHMSPVTASTRTDELWQHTCFEAFVRTSPGVGYYEFKFARSTQCAAY